MLFVYYPKCSTCLKAKKFLDDAGIEYTGRHIKEENPTEEEINFAGKRRTWNQKVFQHKRIDIQEYGA